MVFVILISNLFYALCVYLGYFDVTCDSEPDVYSVLACDSCEVLYATSFIFDNI